MPRGGGGGGRGGGGRGGGGGGGRGGGGPRGGGRRGMLPRPGRGPGRRGGRRRGKGRRRHRRRRGHHYPWYPYPFYFYGYDYEENTFPETCCADLKHFIVRCEDSSWELNGANIEVFKTRTYDGDLWAYVAVPDQPLIPGGMESGWMLVCNIPRARYPGLRPLMRGHRSRKYLGG